MKYPYILLDWSRGEVRQTGDAQWTNCASRPPCGRGVMYGGWRWDGRRLEAEIDAFGFYSLYVHASQDRLCLSPSLLTAVDVVGDAAVDEDAVNAFLAIGVYLGDTTPFRGFRVLPPAGKLIWDSGTTTLTGPARTPWLPRPIGRSDAVDGFIERFRVAMQRLVEHFGDVSTVPLSGGRDSRHIVFELVRHGAKPRECITFNATYGGLDKDARAAAEVTRAVGVPHRLLDGAASMLTSYPRAYALTHLCSDEHYQMLPLRDYLLGKPGVVYDGLAGDILSRNGPFTDPVTHAFAERGDYRAFAQSISENHGRIVGRAHLGLDRLAERVAVGVEAVHAKLLEHRDDADPWTAFLFWNRTRREISLVANAVLWQAPQVLCPYLDPDLVEFMATLPYEVTCDGRLHDEAIARAFPQWATIPYHKELTPVGGRRAPLRKALGYARGLRGLARVGGGAAVLSELSARGGSRLLGKPAASAALRVYFEVLDAATDTRKRRVLLETLR